MSTPILTTLEKLSVLYPEPGALAVGTPYHMVVMVALSARTRDEQILKLAPGFFQKFPTAECLPDADLSVITRAISTIGLYQQKAKNLQKMAQMIVRDFDGEVPRTMEELTRLPGVGRKTASVILVTAFGVPAIAVDTHVHRVVNRFGWVRTKVPEVTERVLLDLLPKKYHAIVNRVFVPFGRTICIPGKPRCWECPLVDECAFAKKNLVPPPDAARIRTSITAMRQGITDLKARLYAALR